MRRLLPLLAILLACGKFRDRKALLDPSLAKAVAPATFRVRFVTTRGEFLADVYRDWAPHGVDRFWNLVRIGFYDNCAFFRVTPQFAQFGLTGEKAVNLAWRDAFLPPDPPRQSNRRGFLSFAQGGAPDKRSTQVFVNRADNTHLDRDFAPIGQVVGGGMDVVDALYAEYGDAAPHGMGPGQGRILYEGNAYLAKEFPHLDYIKRALIVN
ncbi:MAG TPA: peptidylprolyl isomerase [Planctomycetota bacterium]|nr:peptidylprolyl isomerase [Planctomycetota bacterium]